MGVTIDSLQIEIQSSSTNAAQGIDALATSLERLKKNGSFKTVSTNLDRLSTSLRGLPNVHQASNSLRTLANSIEKLKGVGTVSSLANSIAKLPAALMSLGSVDLEKVAPQLRQVAEAVAPLSAIKAGGLNTLVGAIKKLGDLDFGEVAKNLDDTSIREFVERVKVLNKELGPLSEKMTTIKAGFRAINSNARTAARGVKEFGDKVDGATFNFANFVTAAQGVLSTMQPLIQMFTNALDAASEWDGIKYQFGNAFGEQADEYYEKITKVTEALRINTQTFMENSAMATSMLVGFGVDRSDAREMGVGYTELAYDIWAAFNNVYKTLDGADGAMAAVRSAISGEVEPIRRAGFTIVDSQLAITAANHGLAYSTTEATEAQKSYLRYLTLVDQAQKKGIVGTYAREMETAEGMMRTFSQQVKSLSQAFGSLFLPILVKVMPYLQAFVELLTDAVHWVASLFGVEIQDIGDTWHDYSASTDTAVENTEGVTGALNDATQAAKELKNATIGIDELNVISPSSATGGSGGSGGGSGGGGSDGFAGIDVDSLWDDSIFDSVKSKVGEIKEQLKGMFDDWLPTLQVIGGALGAWTIAKLLGQLGDALKLGDAFEGKVTNIKKLAGSAIIIALQFKLMGDAFSDFMGEDGTIFDYIEAALIGAGSTYLLYKQWGKGGLAIGLAVTATASLSAVFENGGVKDLESATVALTGLATGIASVAIAWKALAKSKFIGDLGAFLSLAKKHGVIKTFAAAFPKLSSALSGAAGNLKAFLSLAKEHGIVSTLAATFPKLGSAVSAVTGGLKAIGAAIIAHPWVATAVAVVAAIAGAIILAIVDYDFTEIGYKVGQVLGNAIKSVVDFGKMIWDRLQAGIDWIVDTFDGLTWSEFWAKFVEVGKNCVSGIWQGIKDGWNNFIGNIKEFINGFVQGFKDALGIHSPSKVFAAIGTNIVDGLQSTLSVGAVKDKLTTMWTNAKTWWDGKKESLKAYTPTIGSISTKLSSAWESAKTWWNTKKSALKSYTPSIGSIYDKLKERWDNARTWWNEKKTKAKEYTPSIGSIYEKVYDRWKNARDWWNNKKAAMKSYTPSIGSITDKIKSAWNSAKSWWNKNVGGLSTKLNISVPKIKVKWDTATAFGKSFKYPTGFKLDFAADGGIFDQGSMIWAGERGPEIVANASGGKTGVMNVQQMQDAVYEGVYAAVTAAMRGMSGGSGTQAVNVYLDGKQITSAVEQRQHERGASIMGNEVYSY